MPLSASPAVTVCDLKHTFHFDPTFNNVHLPSDCELRFFSEAFSLIDSMRNLDLLHGFVDKIRKSKGVLDCKEVIDLLKENNLIESSTHSEDEGLHFLFDSLYRVINRIVMDKFVSCMHTSSLGCVAWEVGQLYLQQDNNNDENTKSESSSYWKEKSQAWCELSERFQDLAKYQHKSLKIHHDFQKSNYAPDPRSKYAYGTTALIIFIGFVYLCLKNVTRVEARELVKMLLR